ncbi:outer membrane protein [Tenacibaculum skagerrakense]|uniref:Outer membrane protein n=1 Tax=Tenacibaculum skagerrakense TaxID=186571 RepID=A0A4R2P0W4_9FLAO|nr:TolC family protein [Tenacibaculum skagerrakense]TCP28172.1 outer membrane protein [Tenacibaculum skagerrakense]
MKNTKLILLSTFLLATSFSYAQKQWTLKEAVDHALSNNITIKQNKLSVEIAEKDVKSNKANFFPSVSANTGGNLNFGSTFDPVSNDRVATSTFGGSVGVGASYTVFNGFRNLNTYKQAKLGVESSKLDLSIIENDISLQVVNTYLNVLFAKENLEVAIVQAEISKSQIDRAKAQFNAGSIPKGDLLNIQSTAANDAQNVVTQENRLNIALLQLAQLIQVPYENFDVAVIEVGTPSAALLYSSSNEVYQKALTNRPEIEKAKLNIENSSLGIEIARAGYFPSVSTSANIGTNYGFLLDLPTGVSNTDFFTQLDNNLGYGLGISVNIPIFNGFRNDANVERSKIQKMISENNLENEKLRLQQTIEQAFLDAKAAAKTYEAAGISLEAQKEAFKNAQVSFDYGSMTQFDYDQVRNRLVNAESASIRAKYDYIFKTKVLKFYYGENVLD